MLRWHYRLGKSSGRLLASLAAAMVLAGTSPGRAEATPVEITNCWTFLYGHPHSTVLYSSSTATPAIGADGTIYVGSFDGTFFALTPEGKIKWTFKAGREVHSSAAIGADGTIYFGSRDRKFYALTPEGKLKWTFATDGWVDSSPAIGADGTIYFGSWDGIFYALNPDGARKWALATGAIVDSSPAIGADGTIYFGGHDKKLHALAPDGRARWTFLAGGEITSSPAIGANGTVYFSALDGNLQALNPDGTPRWRTHIGGVGDGSPVLDEAGRIHASAGYTNHPALPGATVCLAPDGRRLWEWPAYRAPMVPPAAATGQIYASRPWNEFHGLSPDGRQLWAAHLLGDPTSAPVIGRDGTIYFSCAQRLYAIRPPQPAPPAQSSWPMFRGNARHTGRVNLEDGR